MTLNLKEFLAIPKEQDRQWIAHPPLKVYMRKARRYYDHTHLSSLEIANVEVEDGEESKGHWKAFISLLQTFELSQDIVYVENVLTEQFASWFRKTGWNEDMRGLIPCYWLPMKDFKTKTWSAPNGQHPAEQREATEAGQEQRKGRREDHKGDHQEEVGPGA